MPSTLWAADAQEVGIGHAVGLVDQPGVAALSFSVICGSAAGRTGTRDQDGVPGGAACSLSNLRHHRRIAARAKRSLPTMVMPFNAAALLKLAVPAFAVCVRESR